MFALYRLNLQIFPTNDALFKVWFIQDSNLFRVWFRQDSGLFRVWFRQVSLYIHNESELTKEKKQIMEVKGYLHLLKDFFLLPQGKRGDNS